MSKSVLEDNCRKRCRALCCYDGVDLSNEEAEKIRLLVLKHPELFPGLPKTFIVDAPLQHQPGKIGLRFALKEHSFFPKWVKLPDGFNNTICVFCNGDYLCQLHAAALKLGIPVSEVKPVECRVFPLLYIDKSIYTPLTKDGKARVFKEKKYHMDLLSYIPCIKNKPQKITWKDFACLEEGLLSIYVNDE